MSVNYSKSFSFLLAVIIFFISCSKKGIIESKLASNAYNEGKYLTAITYANETLKVDPDNYEAYLIKGKSNLKLGSYQEAIKDLSAANKLSKSFDPFYYRARGYLELDELEKSEKDLEEALLINNKSIDALFDLAYVKTNLGQSDLAINAYKKVIQLDTNNSKAFVNLGNLIGRSGESEEAIFYFSQAIKINPNDAIAYFNRATEKLILNDRKGAVEDLSYSASIDSNNISTHFLIAETYLEIKDCSNAIRHIDKIISLDPQNARAYFLKGSAELELKNFDKACLSLRKSGELGYYNAYELITKHCIKKEKKKSKR